ncbi:hypothetical protein Lal_00014281 [Lupinus albus]|nr:hypothetical protein Lal_00014281 [Lupinus albus]
MLEVLQGMNENLRNLNRSVVPAPSSLSQSGFAPNAAVQWALGMGCTNMKADGVATSKSNFPKSVGPHRNFVHGRGKGKMFSEEQELCLSPAGTRRYTSHGPRTHANAGGSRLNSPSWCNKCNRKHDGGSCFGTTNRCSRCKETRHVKRYCPMSRQSMNAMETGRPQSIGRMVTMTSGVDDPARGKLHGDSADKVVAVRDLCEISDQASGLVPVSAKRVRTLIRKRDRYSLSKCHKRMSTRTNIDMGSGVPHSLKFESVIRILNSWKPRLSESCLAWARNGNFGLLTHVIDYTLLVIDYTLLVIDLHSAGNRLHSAGNRLHSAGNRLHSAGNRLQSAGNRLHSAGNRLHISGNRLHRIKSIKYAHFSRCNRLHHVGNRLQPDDTSLKQKPKHIFGLELRREERKESFSRARSLRTHLGA